MLSDRELEEMFDDFLDNTYLEISICGLNYPMSNALKKIDLIAYREYFNNWLDDMINSGDIIEDEDGVYYAKD